MSENLPLAERMRPQTLKDFFGQEHLVGDQKIIFEAIANNHIFSMILWGPPGSGKTTLARILALQSQAEFIHISAVVSNVAEMKRIISEAKERVEKKTILFIDEIHRFNKAQQDVLLPHVEDGTITLIGATTENPSFEVIGPLLSRSRVLVLEPLAVEFIQKILLSALKNEKKGVGKTGVTIEKDALEKLAFESNGDARFALTTLEIAVGMVKPGAKITLESISQALQRKIVSYDKQGDKHFDTISAFIKSMRASATDAALHYLARMIEAGEDPMFIARRLVIFASEDIGNAQPTALVLATSCMQAVRMIGMPEATLILAQTCTYLAEAPKSIASTSAIYEALDDVRNQPLGPIPLHLRNSPTKLMKDLGFGKDHVRYPWMKENQGKDLPEYLPKNLAGKKYYQKPDKK